MAKIRMHSGRLVDPFNLTPEDIVPETFIHHLCLINRFHGATKYPYSVAQHSMNLAYLVPSHLVKAAVIHDFSEAVFNDLASPVKYEFPDYSYEERQAGYFIADVLGVKQKLLEDLKQYDLRIYINERDALFDNIDEIGMGDEQQPLYVPPGLSDLFNETPWRKVKQDFLELWDTVK